MLPWAPAPSFQQARPEQQSLHAYTGPVAGSHSLGQQSSMAGYAGPHYQGVQSQQGGPPPPMQQQGAPMSPAAPPLSLSQVLLFLQTDYRKHERDRNEWEIERAEMRARIALLEGERRASENLRSDLLRRVKMLEFALRGERAKYLSTASARSDSGDKPPAGTASAIPPSKAAQLKSEERPSSPSAGSSPPSDPGEGFSDSASSSGNASGNQPPSAIPSHLKPELSRPGSSASLLNGPAGSERAAAAPSIAGSNLNGTGSLVGPGGYNPAIGRDPKGRAQARFYLKQCLQEIAYLTSPGTLNPLPERGVDGMPRAPPKQLMSLPLQALPQHQQQQMQPQAGPSEPSHGPGILPAPAGLGPAPSYAPSNSAPIEHSVPRDEVSMSDETMNMSAPAMVSSSSAEMTRSVATMPMNEPEPSTSSYVHAPNGISGQDINHAGYDDNEDRLTAVYQPNGEGWRNRVPPHAPETEMAALSMQDSDGEEARPTSVKNDSAKSETRSWKPRKILKSHLDAVRCLAIDRTDLTIASGGDDCTVKIWRLNPAQLAVTSTKTAQPDTEPQITLRGHSAPVTSLAISAAGDRLFSASQDQTVQIWSLPPRDREPYAPYDSSLRVGRLEGHTDAIWALALVPLRVRDEVLLATASADGTVKVWDTEKPALKLSWGYNGTDAETEEGAPAPTSVAVVNSDMRKLAVGYQDAVVKIFDIETGRQLLRLKSDESYDGSPATQVNMIATHPTLPLLVTAHEDRYIRFFDLNTGACTYSVIAHSDAVTAVDIDPSGLTLASAGHDGSIRFWDLLSTRTCIQELSSHRTKGDEGALDVRYHPTLPFLASAGADGVIKVYVSN